ncbi:hypothetical protein E9232_001585 [Inquilinus ginsengisoli]|uniref:DUF4105 domain-containing protein n=1 Tax=Inquilinus ginsengisoli TaxID=363840 RepID=A0ABU1JKF3_9PROT|nr:hypothetical protein [Inquilinus ginsengisoli]MDR6289070.1 hypothetical protein [Inquilinus ginsengisoli]
MVNWSRAIPAYGTLQAKFGGKGHVGRETDQAGVMRATEGLAYPVACIWLPAAGRGYGHASVFIQEPQGEFPETDTSSYASLFPGEDTRTGQQGARIEHLAPGRMLTAEFTCFVEDCAAESGKEGVFRLPDHMVPMGGLDILRMQAAWNAIRDKPDAHYRLMRKNCATIAARVIRAGMATKQHVLSPLLTHKAWWTPHDVLLLAQACPKSDYDRRIDGLVTALKG